MALKFPRKIQLVLSLSVALKSEGEKKWEKKFCNPNSKTTKTFENKKKTREANVTSKFPRSFHTRS